MNIIISSIKRSLRDKNMIITTIFLVIILPFIFSMMYSHENEVQTSKVNIVANKDSSVAKAYINFLEEFDKSNENVEIKYTLNDEKSNNLQVKIDEDNKNIHFSSKDSTINMSEGIIENITKEFFEKLSIYEIGMKNNSLDNINKNVIKSITYKSDKEEVDYSKYFAIVMLQMSALSLSMNAYKNIFYIKQNIGRRVYSSPIKISKLIKLELIGTFITVVLQSIVTLILIYLVYDVNINLNNLFGILYCIAMISLLAISIGIFGAAISKKKEHGDNIVSILTVIFVLLSGRLNPQLSLENKLFKLNAFTNISKAMSSLIDGSINISYSNMTISTVVTVLLLVIISCIILRKRGER
ncbi:ABC transporter permease [Romboutsia sedimentorum]|uniref:ABC transporter permease n=1 Tax=Romboutsia sedimentorum TaxID=1368474 RepID=A0ABT7ECL3_9FIRM|nr:ABC transporter permease [Romboutsia sedimentorum]MDK2564665.1 ABC transporter permease [Romboutsia sedimentorum]MDK2586372.1 ABC transporter permease [Romboutsia sedimentorum]